MAKRFDKKPDSKLVFISYERKTSAEHANALYRALGGEHGIAFLDQEELDQGDKFPAALANAILNSHVFVLLADDLYFQRWFCLRELQTALSPFEMLMRTSYEKSQRDAAHATNPHAPNSTVTRFKIRGLASSVIESNPMCVV